MKFVALQEYLADMRMTSVSIVYLKGGKCIVSTDSHTKSDCLTRLYFAKQEHKAILPIEFILSACGFLGTAFTVRFIR